jgi:hypothetical protein
MSSEKTGNLGLHKWAPTDGVLRTEFNDNFGKIDEKVTEVTTQLEDTAREIQVAPSVVSSHWIPPAQPPARADITGYFADGFNWNADKYISTLWEPLRLTDPQYVKRSSFGKDASGTYDVWKYEFTPPQYEKELIIGAGLHGGETTGMLALYRFLYHVVNDWKKYSPLSYVRNKVKLTILPIQNPWGMSQLPRVRQNANGVDLNRNFDSNGNWATYPLKNPGDHDYKGPSAFSEVETQYIKSVLDTTPNAIAYLDLHNLGTPDADFVVYVPKKAEVNREIYRRVMNTMKPDSYVMQWGEVTNPSSYIYAGEKLGMYASNPEYPDTRFGVQKYDSIEVSKAVEWFGNIILQHTKLEKRTNGITLFDGFVNRYYYTYSGTGNSIVFPVGTNYAELAPFTKSFQVPTKGIVLINGEITIRGTDDSAQHFVSVYGGQERSLERTPVRMNVAEEVYGEGMKRLTLPFSAEIPVLATSDTVGYGNVTVGLSAKTTVGATTVYRYRMRVQFVPSNRKDGFTIENIVY